MKRKHNYNNLPVSKLNEIIYKTAIDRLSKVVCLDECLPGDLIAMQEQEIERYRSKIYFLEEELKKQKSEEAAQVELVAEGIVADDRVMHLNKGDTLILKADRIYIREDMDEIIDKLNHYGINCVMLHKSTKIIGVIEGGCLAEC